MLSAAVGPVPAICAPGFAKVAGCPIHIAGMERPVFGVVYRWSAHPREVFWRPTFGTERNGMGGAVGREPILPIRLRRWGVARMVVGTLQKRGHFRTYLVDQSTRCRH